MELRTSESKFLHKLIQEKNLQYYFEAQTRGISEESFTESISIDVWKFIKKHVEDYNTIPAIETVQEQIPEFTPSVVPDRFEYYRDTVIKQHIRSKVSNFAHELAVKVSEDNPEILEFIGNTYQELIKGARLSDFGRFRDMEDRIADYIQRVASGVQAMGVPTGIGPLDEHFLGFRKGDYGIISGRPGEGKTTVALFMAFSAFMADYKVSYITLEMPREQLFEKLDALATGITINKIKRMDLSEQEIDLYKAKAAEVKDMNGEFRIHDRTGSCTPVTIEAIITQDEPDIVFVDPIYLMKTESRKASWEGIKDNSNKIKALAMKYRTPIVALSQINRSGQESIDQGMALTVADLSFADSLGQDADHVFVLTGNAKTRYHKAKRFTSVKLRGASEKDIAIKWDPTTNFIEYLMEYSQLSMPAAEAQAITQAQSNYTAGQNNFVQ